MMKLELPEGRDRILLHSCCAPCSGAVIECLVENGLRPGIFFSNSNIVPFDEYELRKGELIRYVRDFGLEVIDDDYDHKAWLECVRGLEREPERGARCMECFKFRLLRAARYAAANGYNVLTTTLASSRWKDLEQVNAAGQWACGIVAGEAGTCTNPDAATGAWTPVFWPQNWRKGGLQPRRNEIIREQNFYNQNFCGCEFSNTQVVAK